jgi:hypothetical protein
LEAEAGAWASTAEAGTGRRDAAEAAARRRGRRRAAAVGPMVRSGASESLALALSAK